MRDRVLLIQEMVAAGNTKESMALMLDVFAELAVRIEKSEGEIKQLRESVTVMATGTGKLVAQREMGGGGNGFSIG